MVSFFKKFLKYHLFIKGVIREESKAVRAKGKSPVNKTFASIHKKDVAFAQTKPNQVTYFHEQGAIIPVKNVNCVAMDRTCYIFNHKHSKIPQETRNIKKLKLH